VRENAAEIEAAARGPPGPDQALLGVRSRRPHPPQSLTQADVAPARARSEPKSDSSAAALVTIEVRMDSIVTQELRSAAPTRTDQMRRSRPPGIRSRILEAEARALGPTPAAAQVHHAMGRIFVEQLGDASSAATATERLSARSAVPPGPRGGAPAVHRVGRYEQALALHQREESLLEHDDHRRESLRRGRRCCCAALAGSRMRSGSSTTRCSCPDHPPCSSRGWRRRSATAIAR